ncbi:MAG: hypothetical protein GY909_03235 [Oligoflexia bacterium]|nr:hypothetical protein [Oligoflexia bacterium]
MSDKNAKKTKNELEKDVKICKKKYTKPAIFSEDLMTFGALCNGTATGGRKATPGPPSFCNASRINS